MDWILGNLLHFGVVLELLEAFWILGSIFGFWEVSWTPGIVLAFWEVLFILVSALLFTGDILVSCVDSGEEYWYYRKCFPGSGKCFRDHFTIRETTSVD